MELSNNKARKLKPYIREYSRLMGLRDPGDRFTAKQHLLRICNAFPKIGAKVRPAGGKVTNSQIWALMEYMHENPIGDFRVPLAIPKKAPRLNPKIKTRQRQENRARSVSMKSQFYKSWEWKQARYEAIKKHGPTCMCCGAIKGGLKLNGTPVVIVVDHVKPISRYWELRLDPTNHQVLCDECNMGKGSWDETDWRDDGSILDDEPMSLIEQQLNERMH